MTAVRNRHPDDLAALDRATQIIAACKILLAERARYITLHLDASRRDPDCPEYARLMIGEGPIARIVATDHETGRISAHFHCRTLIAFLEKLIFEETAD